jgi:branched-chain amino acid transport system permease protein
MTVPPGASTGPSRRKVTLPAGNLRRERASAAPAVRPGAAGPGRSVLTNLRQVARGGGYTPPSEASWGATLAGLGALCLIAGVFPYSGVAAQYVTLGVTVFIYAIVASGIGLLYHDGGMLSVAHGGLWGIGAYTAAVLVTHYNWPLIPVILAAIVIVGVGGMSLASISTRVAGSYFIIILFAVSEVIYGVMTNWTSVTNGSEGIVLAGPTSLFGYQITSDLQWYYVSLITLVVALVLLRLIKQSQLGQHLRAIRDSRPLAVSVGISVTRVHMACFAITGAMAGVAGVYWAYLEKYVVPSEFSATASIDFVVVVLLGGSAYLLGPLLGAIVVIFLPQLLGLAPLLTDAIIGVIFIAVILLFPEGVVGLITRSLRWLTAWTGIGRWPRLPGRRAEEALEPTGPADEGLGET